MHVGVNRRRRLAGLGGGGDDAAAADKRVSYDGLARVFADALVGLEYGVGHVAALLAVHARGGDVHAVLAQARGNVRKHAGFVDLLHHDGVVLAGDVHVHAVDLADNRRAAAHAFAAHAHAQAVGAVDDHVDGVGVLVVVRIGQGSELKMKPRFARVGK